MLKFSQNIASYILIFWKPVVVGFSVPEMEPEQQLQLLKINVRIRIADYRGEGTEQYF